MNTSVKTRRMAMTAALTAVIILMSSVPFLGYIPLGFMNATILHVPVIVGAVLLGPKAGAFLGLVFGITSVVKNTLTPNPTSFVFSPFYATSVFGVQPGSIIGSLIIAIVPRVLIGVVAYFVYAGIKKAIRGNIGRTAAYACAGVAGSLTNTILVMNLIYVFFGQAYASASGRAFQTLYGYILAVIVGSGIPEAIVGGILTAVISTVLFKVVKEDRK
ncbi:MAG: ECF transporter S component [Lachnospiraceae bacterium]|nr:ECF transporter S component [Lachnospiraceae bacterium]